MATTIDTISVARITVFARQERCKRLFDRTGQREVDVGRKRSEEGGEVIPSGRRFGGKNSDLKQRFFGSRNIMRSGDMNVFSKKHGPAPERIGTYATAPGSVSSTLSRSVWFL
uniref:Uncharacterized protein n=1 Tax=Kwoniella pini CBS 10737 TaxID=1296096 RepID=A0A1B9HTZ7_9TREE|nr:uncharacterized protein I206_07128 [Kwoniella pini CBS 10737]OCF46741.1 hypothetical protein I206_07128 [Kwoniella pini CBS 10737]